MGTYIISGGMVVARGADGGSGIGSGPDGIGGVVRITGGTVSATGSGDGAGIGSGKGSSNFSVEITGGMVTAQSSYNAAGIGGGYNGTKGTVRISGGTVKATSSGYGAGIGAGDANSRGLNTEITVEISGGIVTATSGSACGIGPADWTTCGAITISGGTINARSTRSGVRAIGRSTSFSAESVTITGGAVYVDKSGVEPAPKNTRSEQVFPVDFDIGLPTNRATSFEMGSYSYGLKDVYTDESGKLRLWLPATGDEIATTTIKMSNGSTYYFCFEILSDGTVKSHDYLIVNGEFVFSGRNYSGGNGWRSTADGTVYLERSPLDVSGVSTNGELRIVVSRDEADAVTLSNLKLVSPNTKDVPAFSISNTACTITLNGSNIIVAQGQYSSGIEVASNSVLTVKGEGALAATGGKSAAGIGSAGGYTPPGKIVIEGGTIVAQGGEKAAGIGGGVSSTLDKADNIVIKGGIVTAKGGEQAAGIGSGVSRDDIAEGAVRIEGGTVLAISGGGSMNASDMVASGNPVFSPEINPLVITGGSVHGANGYVSHAPVDANATKLSSFLFTNLTAGATVSISSEDIPSNCGLDGIVADSTGSVCIWLPQTNSVYDICVNGGWFSGNASTNNIFSSESGSSTPMKLMATGSGDHAVPAPDGLTMEHLAIGPDKVTLVVSATPAGWIGSYAEKIAVICAAGLADLSSGDPSRVTRFTAESDDVNITVNADGTATMEIPRSSTAQNMFYKLDVQD